MKRHQRMGYVAIAVAIGIAMLAWLMGDYPSLLFQNPGVWFSVTLVEFGGCGERVSAFSCNEPVFYFEIRHALLIAAAVGIFGWLLLKGVFEKDKPT